jgi:hypothetical protein
MTKNDDLRAEIEALRREIAAIRAQQMPAATPGEKTLRRLSTSSSACRPSRVTLARCGASFIGVITITQPAAANDNRAPRVLLRLPGYIVTRGMPIFHVTMRTTISPRPSPAPCRRQGFTHDVVGGRSAFWPSRVNTVSTALVAVSVVLWRRLKPVS